MHSEQVRLADVLDKTSKADLAAHSMMEQMMREQNAPVAAQLKPYMDKLNALVEGERKDGREVSAGLDDLAREASQIYGQLEQSDNPPTQAQLKVAAHVHEEAEEIEVRWQKYLNTQKPAIDRILTGANLPTLDARREPDYMPSEGDED